jgi:hypothetical protein
VELLSEGVAGRLHCRLPVTAGEVVGGSKSCRADSPQSAPFRLPVRESCSRAAGRCPAPENLR